MVAASQQTAVPCLIAVAFLLHVSGRGQVCPITTTQNESDCMSCHNLKSSGETPAASLSKTPEECSSTRLSIGTGIASILSQKDASN